jgi:hypothetical protein
MSITQSLIATHVIETAHDYTRADDPLRDPEHLEALHHSKPAGEGFAYFDEEGLFWDMVFHIPSHALNQTFRFQNMRLSEWVPRVPGLTWKPESEVLRSSVRHAQKIIGGYAYPPETRSIRVLSGVGTMRLPPSDEMARLGTLMLSGDVAAGVPVLMSADMWDYLQIDNSSEGRVISGSARWVSMSLQWANNFPVVRDIPRGYLLLNDPDAITIEIERAQTYLTPFSIMAYESGASELFDYVYAGARTDEKGWRDKVEDFFQRYHQDVSPHSHYLIAGDMVQPMWDSEFLTPSDLRRQDAGAKSQLSLLEARVRENMLGKQTIELLLDRLGQTIVEPDILKVLSDEIQLPTALWKAGGSLTDQISQFVDAAVQHEKLDRLIVNVAARNPDLFVSKEEE